MISRYAAWLNDEALNLVNPNIYVADISYSPMERKWNTTRLGSRNGVYSTGDYLESNSVTIAFELREYDTAKRQSAMQDIIRWCADGGWLQTSDRPLQRIYVRCTRLPAVTSVMKWTDIITIEFTAFDLPYWQYLIPNTAQLSDSVHEELFNPGAFPANVTAEITAGAAITGIALHCADTEITLTGLTVASGDKITVSYTDDHHLLEIKQGNTSILSKRTAGSSDDLTAAPGLNEVWFTADGTAGCVMSVRGLSV